MTLNKSLLLALAFAGLTYSSTSTADTVADFYRGKSVTLAIGFGPGGGYDSYARVLARHLGKYIPGNPAVIPQNMPGGGGLTLVNYLYNVAPRDGLYLAMFGPFTTLEPLFGNVNARFDPTKFSWVGNMNIDAGACGSWRGSGIETFPDTLVREAIFGSSGQGSTTTQQVLVLKNLLGSRARIVQGYKGSMEITLAMRRGEVSATCGLYVSNVITLLKEDISRGDMRIFIQFGRTSFPEFGSAANIYDLLKNDEDKQVADIIFRPNEMGRPIAGPPEIPEGRLKALREAFMAAMNDPALLGEMKKLSLPVNPTTGDSVAQLMTSFYSAPKPLVKRAVTIMTKE